MQNRNINRSTNLMQAQYTSQNNNIVAADLFIIVKFTHSICIFLRLNDFIIAGI